MQHVSGVDQHEVHRPWKVYIKQGKACITLGQNFDTDSIISLSLSLCRSNVVIIIILNESNVII